MVRVGGDLEDPSYGFAPGTRFHSHYEIVRRLGEGGMGVVFEVRDHRIERRRALKILRFDEPSTPELLARFRLEATATAAVRNRHLVEVLDAGLDEAFGRPFLVMELLEGESVEQRLRRVGKLARDEVISCVDAIANALDALHSHGVVHRDLKPQNLFFARDDEDREVLKVLDFGAVKVLSESLRTTRALGSPLYMSPEALEGDGAIDGRADVYALGHVAFTLLVGDAYWERLFREARGYHAVLVRVLRGSAPDAQRRAAEHGVALPGAMNAWFAKATAKRPEDRFDTAGECAAAFARAIRGERFPGRGRRRAWGLLFGAGFMGASSAALAVTLSMDERGAQALPALTSSPPSVPVTIAETPETHANVRESTSSAAAAVSSAAKRASPSRIAGPKAAPSAAPSMQPSAAPSAEPLRPPTDPARLR